MVLSIAVFLKGELVGLIIKLKALEGGENLRTDHDNVIEVCVAKGAALIH